MGDTPSTDRKSLAIQRQLDAMLAQWEEALKRGVELAAAELCPEDAVFAEEMQQAIDQIRRLQESDEVACPPDAPLPNTIGPYRVIEELARGGSSRVLLCEQPLPLRQVAVKLLDRDALIARRLRRFRLEVQLLANLSHPGIAQIYDAGMHDVDTPYLVMEYVAGQRLDEYLRSQSLSVEEKLKLILRVAEALQYAHENYVIHRDLKPANILIGHDGHPKIVDFGIARLIAPHVESTGNSTTRLMVGTAPYMSPEQFQEDPSRIDVRTDVYGLAVVFFEMLTGELPYNVRNKSFVEAAQVVRTTAPRSVPRLDARYDRNLNVVVQKALSKEPNERYQTVREFADDLHRLLDHVPVLAKRTGPIGQLGLWARRNRRTAAMTCIVALLLLVSSILSTSLAVMNVAKTRQLRNAVNDLQSEQARTKELAATVQQRNADLQSANDNLSGINDRLRRTAMNANMMRASSYLQADPVLAESILRDESLCPPDLRGQAWQLLIAQPRRSIREIQVTKASFPNVYSTALSRDGKVVVTLTLQNLRWWNVENGTRLHSVTEKLSARSQFALDDTANRTLVSRDDGIVLLIDVAAPSKTRIYDGADGRPSALAVSPNGTLAAVGNGQGRIYLYDADTGSPMRAPVEIDQTAIVAMRFDANDQRLLALSGNGAVATIDVGTGVVVTRQTFPESPLTWGEISADLNFICGRSGEECLLWDRDKEAPVTSISGPEWMVIPRDPVASLIIGNRTSVKSLAPDGTESVLHIREAAIESIGLSEQSNRLAVGGRDGVVTVYDLNPLTVAQTFPTTWTSTLHVRFSPDSRLLAVIGSDPRTKRELQVLRTEDGSLVTDFGKATLRGRDVAFSSDGGQLFTSDESDTVQVWNIATGKQEGAFSQPDASFRSIAVAPDASRLYLADIKASEVVALSLPSGECLARMPCPADPLRDIMLTSDGKQLYSVHYDGTISNWNTESFTLNWQTKLDHPQIRELCMSPDGLTLVTISQRGSPRVWGIAPDGLYHLATLQSVSPNLMSMAFSLDGSVLASSDFSGNLVLWDAMTWQPQAILPHTHTRLRTLAFSPDGRRLVVAGTGPGLTVWDLPDLQAP